MFKFLFARILAIAFLFSLVLAPMISEANVHSEHIHSAEYSQLLTPVIPKLIRSHSINQEASKHPVCIFRDFKISEIHSDTASCVGCHAFFNNKSVIVKNIYAGGHANRLLHGMGSCNVGVFKPLKVYGYTGACKCHGYYLT